MEVQSFVVLLGIVAHLARTHNPVEAVVHMVVVLRTVASAAGHTAVLAVVHMRLVHTEGPAAVLGVYAFSVLGHSWFRLARCKKKKGVTTTGLVRAEPTRKQKGKKKKPKIQT